MELTAEAVNRIFVGKDGKLRIGGKGKGKGEEKNGKGKGKGKSRTKGDGGSSNEHKSYYFDVFPERANGRRVVKCTKAGCYGCCLDGDKRPEVCNKCETPFKFGNSRAASAGSERADQDKAKDGPKKSTEKSDDDMYKELEEEGHSHEQIMRIFSLIGRKHFKGPKPKSSTSTEEMCAGVLAVNKLKKEQVHLDSLLTAQWTKHKNLLDQVEKCEDKIEELAKRKTQVLKEVQQWTDKTAGAIGLASVATAVAQGLDDESHLHMQELQERIVEFVPAEHQDTILKSSYEMVHAAQVFVQTQKIQHEEDKRKQDIIIKELQDAVAELKILTAFPATPQCAASNAANVNGNTPMPVPGPLITENTAEQIEVDEDNQLGLDCGIDDVNEIDSVAVVTSLHPADEKATDRDDVTQLAAAKKQRALRAQKNPLLFGSANMFGELTEASAASESAA